MNKRIRKIKKGHKRLCRNSKLRLKCLQREFGILPRNQWRLRNNEPYRRFINIDRSTANRKWVKVEQ